MKPLTKNHWLIIAGAFILTFLLYLAPRKIKTSKEQESLLSATQKNDLSIDNVYQKFCDSVLKKVNPELAKKYTKLASNNPKNDSLFEFFKQLKQPFLAAYWAGKIAEQNSTFNNLITAGQFYSIGFEFAPSPTIKHLANQKAIEYYTKALQINPNHQQTKINLANCYVEGSSNPMKGIEILREVLQNDSNNIAAQFKMGIFAVRSQQLNKAVERFKKVLSLDPNHAEAMLYLGECYANLGNKTEALKYLEQFKNISNDAIINAEVDDFINKLKK
jgi:tetratricopeptide (TPR) repeat protein